MYITAAHTGKIDPPEGRLVITAAQDSDDLLAAPRNGDILHLRAAKGLRGSFNFASLDRYIRESMGKSLYSDYSFDALKTTVYPKAPPAVRREMDLVLHFMQIAKRAGFLNPGLVASLKDRADDIHDHPSQETFIVTLNCRSETETTRFYHAATAIPAMDAARKEQRLARASEVPHDFAPGRLDALRFKPGVWHSGPGYDNPNKARLTILGFKSWRPQQR